MISSPNVSQKCSSERGPVDPLKRDRKLQTAPPELVDGRAVRQRKTMEIHLSLNQYSPKVYQLFFPRVSETRKFADAEAAVLVSCTLPPSWFS